MKVNSDAFDMVQQVHVFSLLRHRKFRYHKSFFFAGEIRGLFYEGGVQSEINKRVCTVTNSMIMLKMVDIVR